MKKIIGIVIPILMMVMPYTVLGVLGMSVENEGNGAVMQWAGVALYFGTTLINVVWLIYQTAAGIPAQTLFLWDMLIKLCYIPFFIMTGIMVLAGFALFIRGGILTVAAAWILDILFLLPPSIYGVCGCIRAGVEKKAGVGLCIVMAILHFVFFLDVVAAIVMFCVVRKPKRQDIV